MNPISLPEAFLQRMRSQLGGAFPAFEEGLLSKPIISLRLNPAKPSTAFATAAPVPWCPEGRYLDQRPSFYQDPLIFAGAYYVQEASSMILHQAVQGLGPGLRVLDLCASPGGKSTLLAASLPADALVVSNELVGARLGPLEENLVRWGCPRSVVTSSRPADFSGLTHFFDLILVDAPCSGEGMFRKDPDTISHWSPGNLLTCESRQKEILEAVLPALKPGGRLIYSTCTFNPGENEQQVRWLLDHDPCLLEMVPVNLPADWGWMQGDAHFGEEMAHTWRALPHLVKGEGFFFAVLQKTREGNDFHSAASSTRKKNKPAPRNEPAGRKNEKPPANWLEDWLCEAGSFLVMNQEETASAIPGAWEEEINKLRQHVRVRKAGIELGEWKHGKFIPSHDLALTTQLAASVPGIDVSREDALRFLKKMDMQQVSLPARGWYVVKHQNLGIGWVRALDNRMNNHLPGHLRIQKPIEGIG